MTAPPNARAGLMALYAFNLEIARAPWVASEPMLVQIRLKWWMEAIAEIFAGHPPRRHEIVGPLAEMITASDPPRHLFDDLIEVRQFDAEREPHASPAALEEYIARTSGNLMELAARALDAPQAALPVVREFARGAGMAAYLRALPELRARGREPLPAGSDIAGLAGAGLDAITRARAGRATVPAGAVPALLPGWLAATRLRRAASSPQSVYEGALEVSEIRARAELILRAATGRW